MNILSRRAAVVVHDLVMVVMAFSAAFLFPRTAGTFNAPELMVALPFVVVIQGLILWWFRLYRGVWRFVSIPDLWNIVRAAIFGALAISLALFLFNRLEGVPRSTLALYPFLFTFFIGTPRLAYRVWRDQSLKLLKDPGRKHVMIIGAGQMGEMLAREMMRDPQYVPVGLLDDNPRLKGAKVQGVPVHGSIEQLPELVEGLDVDLVVIAIPSATSAEMQRVVEICERAEVTFRTLPRLQDVMSGKSSIHEMRQVSIEDLLGREPITLDWNLITQGLAGKTVLVSGGGGSIGSELCRQVARLGPARLVIFEKSEFNLYSIEHELRGTYPQLDLRARLGDVSDAVATDRIMYEFRPSVVFHAAAYKHVPMLESQVREAFKNNVHGTKLLALAAEKHGCEKFVMISTDKAVNPTNVMGTTKRIAEIFCQNLSARSKTAFITVRFGNVLGSAGSVVPLFQKQIDAGGPVTVTHREMQRYFMTIPEACQLIMQASVMGAGGEIFVLDMGEPIKISYLAEQMIRLSGKVPGKDIEISYTGLRPGEKLFEELFHEQENLTQTRHQKILLAQCRRVEWDALNETLDKMKSASDRYDEEYLRAALRGLVPEFKDELATAQEPVPPIEAIAVMDAGTVKH